MNRRQLRGFDSAVFSIGAAALLFGQLYLLYLAPISPLLHGLLFLSTIMALSFIKLAMLPIRGERGHSVPIYDYALAALALVPLLYAYQDYNAYVRRATLPNQTDVAMGILLVVLLLEAGRRSLGWILPILGGLAFLFAISGLVIPAEWGFAPRISLRRVVGTMTMTEIGLFSEPLQVALCWIFIFIVFGVALAVAGGLVFFEKVSIKVAGGVRGGPAYISVISSALFGTVSGSNVANVMSTGQMTIPLMTRVGYGRLYAGAIESVSSTGGALTPPVMGAAALIMAELANTPYLSVIASATLPAILYYIAIVMFVYAVTIKRGIAHDPQSVPDTGWQLLARYWIILLGIGWLLYRIISFYPLEHAALQASAILLIGALIYNREAFRPAAMQRTVNAVADGAIDITLACGVSGLLVGVILVTGLGIELSSTVVRLGETSLLLALIATMVVTIILGAAVPGIAAYIIAASVVASPLSQLGVPLLAAHMFIFYFSLFSGLTPPVALTAFAAASISGADPLRTAFVATTAALPAYLLAFFFVYQPELLLLAGSATDIVLVFATTAVGVAMMGLGGGGAIFVTLRMWERLALFAAGIALVEGSMFTDSIGIGTGAVILLLNIRRDRRQKAMAKVPAALSDASSGG
jgi:TRAP transporter 4TM/12TM fusion protein